jgi:hypothetical protein
VQVTDRVHFDATSLDCRTMKIKWYWAPSVRRCSSLNLLWTKIKNKGKKAPWPGSTRELYRLSDRRLSVKLLPTFANRGVSRSPRGGSPTTVISFLDRSRFFFQVTPQLYSRDCLDPVSDPLLLRKSGNAGNRTRTLGSVARNSDHKITEAVELRWMPIQFLTFFHQKLSLLGVNKCAVTGKISSFCDNVISAHASWISGSECCDIFCH